MSTLPTGTMTFLFTDIEHSTLLWEQHPEAMKSALAKHDTMLKEAIEANHGHVIKTTGDGFHAVFEKAIDAVNATIAAQRMLQNVNISNNSGVSIRVRMGLHTGEAESRDGDYYGQTLNRAARIMSIGHGGQILLSEITAQVAREHLPKDISCLDLGAHHLKGLVGEEHIYQLVAPGLPQKFPALQSIEKKLNNLPTQITSFIGRERELTETARILEKARLLTLIGPGGTGKTRLSLQLAANLLSSFKDGVWLAEFAPLSNSSLILQNIASALSLREQPGMPLKELVHDFLRDKQLLLIFDNCEHLIETCAQLADEFLHIAPNIKIIASSREALGINGETVYRVPSLSLPDQAKVTREAALRFESVQLFAERASAANPKFRLTDENASFVAQICSRLDGIPLAIELSASRVAVFSPEQIAMRLDDRFKLLTGGSRTALPRQQTLRALIDWSYDLLSEPERALLRRLSVFAGGWTFEAAESICSNMDILELLPQLVNKSLVVVDEEGGEPRYHLLETIRQYARDKLLEAGESAEARNLHLDYFVSFSEKAGPRMDTSEILEWIPRLDAEYDNVRVAFEWGLENKVEACLKLVGDLAYYWFRRGHGAEGIQMASEALARADLLPKPQEENAARYQMMIRAKALQAISFLAYSQGDNPNAYKAGSECIALARQLGDKRMLATALAFSGSAKLFAGDLTDALAHVEEAIAITREAGEKLGLGIALGMMAQIATIKDHDPKAAQAYEQESLVLTAESGNNWLTIMLFFGTGRGAMLRGDYATARERFAKCLPVFEEMKDEHRVNMIHSEFAHMDRYEGKYQQAEEAYRKTILTWQKLGHRAAIAHQLESFAFIAIPRGQLKRAARLLGAAEILREKIKIDMSPTEREEYEKEVAKLRAGMDENVFMSAWVEGRSLSMDEAIKFALS